MPNALTHTHTHHLLGSVVQGLTNQKEVALQKYTKMYTLTHVAESLLGQHGGDGAVPGTFVWGAAWGNHPVLTVRQVHGARADRTGAQWAGAIIPPAAAQPLVLRKTEEKRHHQQLVEQPLLLLLLGFFNVVVCFGVFLNINLLVNNSWLSLCVSYGNWDRLQHLRALELDKWKVDGWIIF